MSFTILTGKEGNSPKKSLFLITITAVDGDVTYLTTAANYGTPGIVYAGNTFQARIQKHDVDAIVASSVQGIQTIPGATLTIADADKSIWLNHCIPHGWRGASVQLMVVLWDLVANQYSTDVMLFTFLCGNPQHRNKTGETTVDVVSAINFSRTRVPSIPLEFRCPWAFPSTYLQRVDALNNPTSIYYQDGYSADVPGGVGNLITGTVITGGFTFTFSTSITVASTTGFPAVPFQATIRNGNAVEEILVTAVSGTTLTIQRGQHGTQAGNFPNFSQVLVPFTTCDFTRSSLTDPSVGCMARMGNAATTSVAPDGDLAHDKAGNYTARFGGVTWIAPAQFSGRSYTSGQKVFGFNQPNTALAGQYYTWVYGTQWVSGQVLAPANDPNTLRSEVAICVAAFGPAVVRKLLVNGVEIPRDNISDLNFSYGFAGGPGSSLGSGGRSGALLGGPIFNKQGDPHGSICLTYFVVPVQLASGGAPTVQALVTGGPILNCYAIASVTGGVVTFTGPNWSCAGNPPFTVVIVGNSNPALNGVWGLSSWTSGPPGTVTLTGTSASGTGGGVFFYVNPDLVDDIASPACNLPFAYADLATWGNITLSQIDPVSFYNAAQIARNNLNYIAADGSTKSHAQFKACFQLQGNQRQVLGQAMTALANAGNLMVGLNSTTGQMECFVKQTLADQQPSAVAGSNYNTAVSSKHADGSAGTGYFAYLFDETVIEKDSFAITTTRFDSTPNTVAFPFQDEYNAYQQDSLTETEATAYALSGNQEVDVPIPFMGVPNFDQGMRVANVQLAEALFGNPRSDAGGTLYFEFMVNQRVLHLIGRLGFICGLTWQALGIGVSAPQPVRVLSLKPDTDGKHWQVKVGWHDDNWYTYAYGQDPTPFQRNPFKNLPNRPPFPWRPHADSRTSDPLLPGVPCMSLWAHPNGSMIFYGHIPVNQLSQITTAPRVPLQASVSSGSGTYPFVVAVAALDVNGNTSGPSSLVTAVGGTPGSSITIPNVTWEAGATGYKVYYGPDSLHMWQVATSATTPSSITFGPGAVDGDGMPDVMFSKFRVILTPIRHGGIWGSAPSAIASPTITFPGASAATNDYAGRILSFYGSNNPNGAVIGSGQFTGYARQFPYSFAIASNTSGGVMTLTGGISGGLFFPGDAFVVRAQANIASANTIGDSFFVNPYAPSGLTVNAEIGKVVWIMAGTGAGQRAQIVSNTATTLTISGSWTTIPDATSVFVVLESAPAIDFETSQFGADGVSVVNALVAQLNTPGTGSYLLQVVTEDAAGNPSPPQYAPFQEIYIFNSDYSTVTPSSGNATLDRSNGDNFRLGLNGTAVNILAPVFSNGKQHAAGDEITVDYDQDATGDRAVPTHTGGVGGFVASTQAQIQMDGTPSTRTAVKYRYDGSYWSVKSQSTGASLT